MERNKLGGRGERLAADYLRDKGYTLLELNFRRLRCEIDLIMRDGDMLVFIEVKSRQTTTYGSGRESVTIKKQANIIKAAQFFIEERGFYDLNARFDVVEVDFSSGTLTHIKDAFTL